MSPTKSSAEKWDSAIPIPKMKTTTTLLLISLSAFISYSKSLNASFVFDDYEAVLNNKDVTSNQTTLFDIFLHDFWGTSISHAASHKSYRPLTILCFRLLNRITSSELNPNIYHCFNIFLHTLVSCVTFFVYNIMLEMRCPKCAFCCAVLFAIHPVHTESVVGIVGQAELLSAFFALTSFVIFYYGCVCKRSLIWNIVNSFIASIFSIIAMLCKEQGITIIGVIFTYDFVIANKLNGTKILELMSPCWKYLHRRNMKNDHCGILDKNCNKTNGIHISNRTKINTFWLYPMAVRQAILIFVTGFVLYVRWLLMGSSLPVFQETDNPTSFQHNFFNRILNYNYIYLINIWILICPEWLCFDWSMGCIPLIELEESKIDVRIGVVILFWTILLILIRAVYKSTGSNQRTLVIGLSSMFILFSPASNIFFKVGFVVAERVLYLPSLGYFLVIVVGLRKLASLKYNKKALQLLMLYVSLIFVLRSIRRTEDWLNEKQLFESALSVCPLNAKVHYNLAKNLGDRGLKKFAVEHYEEALRLRPNYYLAMNNLANIYRDEGNLTKAEQLLIKAVDIRPDFATAWMNLGIVYSTMGTLNKSETCYLQALKFRKKYPDCLYNLGNLYLELGRNVDALAAWKNATFLKPTHRIAWSNVIVMLDSMGRLYEALYESYNALSHLPNEASIHFNLANVLGKLNEYEKSEKHFLQSIRLNSSVAAYHYNLGVLYHRWNKFCKAKFYYIEADRLDSNSKAKKQLNVLEKAGKIENCISESTM